MVEGQQEVGEDVSAVQLPKQPDGKLPKQEELLKPEDAIEPLSRAEFERLIAERETRWQTQLEELKRTMSPEVAATHDVAAVELRQQQREGELRQQPDGEETQAERKAREDRAAQRTRAAVQTRQAVEGFGTTGTLPVNGSAAPHNPIAHIDDLRELYRLARRELEQGRKVR